MYTARMLLALFVTAACVYGIESAANEDNIVPETINFMETLMQPMTIPNAHELQDDLDHFEDDSDHDQLKKATPDSEGNNPITGEPVTKTSNGMKDTHLRENTEMGRRYVNNPGYTPADSSTSAGKHYYLGNGRRRIGAGFGRRRAPVQTVNKQDELAFKKRYQTKLKDKKFMAKLTAMAHNMVSGFSSKSKKGSNAQKLSKEEIKAYAEEIMGLNSGPSFYSSYNYKGTSVTKSLSISTMGATQITNNNLSSLKVPKGWCVTLFTKKRFQGHSLKLCATRKGPNRVWNLQKYPLTLQYGNIAAKDFNSGPTSDYKTTWNNKASSIGLTKFHYVRHEVPQKCVKTCGVAPHIFVGKVTCTEFHFREKRKTVANKNCRAVGLRMPQIPKLSCPATPACVNYKTSKSTVTCAKCCGFQGKTYYGKVWCQVRLRNKKDGILPELCFPGTKDCEIRAVAKDVKNEKHVGNPKCMHWELVMPPRPPKECSKMPACTAFETKTPYQLGKRCTKTCSFNGNTFYGTSFCKKTGFNKNAGVVNQGCSEQSVQDKTLNVGKTTDSKCSFWNQSKPAVPKQVCPSTKPCTYWKTIRAPQCRTLSCGAGAYTQSAQPQCTQRNNGAHVADSACAHWKQAKPSDNTRHCIAAAACTPSPTPRPTCKNRCCTFSIYRDDGYRHYLGKHEHCSRDGSDKIFYLTEKEDDDISSFKLEGDCLKVLVYDDDRGSGDGEVQNEHFYSSQSKLVNDLDNDIEAVTIWPKGC